MSASVNKQVDVKITGTASGCTVTPGDVVVASNDTINFINLTEAGITVQFFEDGLFSSAVPGRLGKGEQWSSLVLKVERGFYPYAVYCECSNDFAVGGSMPIIIIKR